MVVCVPVTEEGWIDPRWGRARRLAIAQVEAGTITRWEELDVGWGDARNTGSERAHHARVARFIKEHHVETVLVDHMGDDMLRILARMGVTVHLGASGDARQAVKLIAGESGRREPAQGVSDQADRISDG
jgi:predicted Fe-Mo cluster-binding NifX family protein